LLQEEKRIRARAFEIRLAYAHPVEEGNHLLIKHERLSFSWLQKGQCTLDRAYYNQADAQD